MKLATPNYSMFFKDRRPDSIRRILPILRVLSLYFRAEVNGLEKIPPGAALLVGNHSGGMGSPDFVFAAGYFSRFGASEPFFALGHDVLTRAPLLGGFLRRFGLVRATPENALQILRNGGKVLVYPGGDLDSLRPSRDRKKIIFGERTGFIKVALEAGVPIVPVVTAGSHETFYVATQGLRLAKWLNLDRLLRMHSFPVILCLPWVLVVGPLALIPYLPLPAKVTVQAGDPILLDKADVSEDFRREYRQVHSAMQSMLDRLYSQRRLPVLG